MSQIADNRFPCVMLLGGLSVNLKPPKNWQGLPQDKAFLGAWKGTQDTPPPNGFTTRQRHTLQVTI